MYDRQFGFVVRAVEGNAMQDTVRKSGIDAVGDLPWGSHFFQFYDNEANLTETLVPYFEAGLKDGESCLWVTEKKLDAQKAEALMVDAVPDFKRYIASGQMEIVSIFDWYSPGDIFNADTVLQGWVDKEALSKSKGFSGLRLTGDTAWIERLGWNNFMEYERKVNSTFRRYNLVALCTYCMENCSASDVINVCCEHQFALARRDGNWELLESSSLKVAKNELIRANIELESRVAERTNELSTSLRARDEFLAMLGHELRNPLAPIRNSADVIRRLTPEHSPLAASAQILHRQVGHLTRLVDDLLDVARVTQGQIKLEATDTPLADIISMAVEQSRPFIDQRNHALSVSLPPRMARVHADPTRLAQVFGNLLHNAAKYTPDGGNVSITTRIEDAEIIVCVQDDGAGIPAPMLESIFGLFAQLPRSLARSDGGLGIGLTLAKRIVEMHGGAIEAYSGGQDLGTQFTVRLALASAPATIAALPPAKLPTVAATPGARRVLLVDDNDDAREAMGILLQMHGHEVAFARDGQSALAQALQFKPDVVILDIGLPDIDGYEVARRLRMASGADVPKLIALTGYGQLNDLRQAAAAGFDAHLLKPAQMPEIINKIATLTNH